MAVYSLYYTDIKWYELHDYISLFFPVIDVPAVINPESDRFCFPWKIYGATALYDVTPPTAKGGMQWLSTYLRTASGWSSEAQSQWVSQSVNPAYFKHLTRSTISQSLGYGYYLYGAYGDSDAVQFGGNGGNTSRYDLRVWVRDTTGTIYPLSEGNYLHIGDYAYPVNDDNLQPNNNYSRVTTSDKYGITSISALKTSDWNSKPGDAYWQIRKYSAIYAGPGSDSSEYAIRRGYEHVLELSAQFTEYIPNDDPYGDDGDGSGGFGGGGGDGSRESWDDTISVPDMPGLTLGSLGSMGIFTPSASQLQSFFKYLWSDAFSVDGFKKILSDPMQAIISLHALPCAVGAGSSAEVAFGNISTGVSMPRVSSEWLTVDCGSIPFKKYYGSFFDYSPYTKYQIYLPYIGYKDISPDDFVGGDCHVVYHVHVPSGACMCYLISGAVDGSVLYQFGGSCLMQLPITSGTYNNFVGSVMTGLASGASALGNISSVAGKVASGALSAAASASSAVASLGSVLSSKPTVSRSGTISGVAGWMARQIPYVIRTRPNAVLTENLNSFQGYPLYRSRLLSQMSGYTVIEDIHLSGLSATADEADEIERLLKEGAIF